MTFWLKCSIETGMFPGEYAVLMETCDAGTISLFAPEDKIRVQEKLMQVELLKDSNGAGALVRLPAQPFEITSQIVKVSQNSLVKSDDSQQLGNT